MNQYLIFQLHGPLAAWGEPAVGESRPSETRPGRSHVLGLLAAALGIPRTAEAKHKALAAGYAVAVRVLSRGDYLRDYHTVQIPPAAALKKHPHATRRDELLALDAHRRERAGTSGTLLSSREYRANGHWQVAVKALSGAPYPLPDLVRALEAPTFTLYLGRKSCPPALPLAPRCLKADDLRQALEAARLPNPKALFGELPPFSENIPSWDLYWDEEMESSVEREHRRETLTRNDRLISRRRWQFGQRTEYHGTRNRGK